MRLPSLTLNFRTLFWGGAAIVLLLLLVFAFRPQPVPVDLAEARGGELVVTARDEGRTRVRETYAVSAPLSGRLLRVGNRAGEYVTAGEAVASILPGDPVLLDERTRREAEAAVRAAESALALAGAERDRARALLVHAETEAARVESLYAQDAASRSNLDDAVLALRAAQAAVNTAQANIGMNQASLEAARIRLLPPDETGPAAAAVDIRAPVSGRVLRVLQESESVIPAGAPIMEVGDPGDLEIVAEFLSTDAVRIEEGAEAGIESWGGPPLRGRVRLVEPYGFLKISALGVEEQRVNVIIDLLDPPEDWTALGHGYRVEAAAVVWRAEDVVQVPVGALFRERGSWAVFRVEDGRARLTRVEVGENDGTMAEIRDGLSPGDRVVLHPGQSVADGVRVRARDL